MLPIVSGAGGKNWPPFLSYAFFFFLFSQNSKEIPFPFYSPFSRWIALFPHHSSSMGFSCVDDVRVNLFFAVFPCEGCAISPPSIPVCPRTLLGTFSQKLFVDLLRPPYCFDLTPGSPRATSLMIPPYCHSLSLLRLFLPSLSPFFIKR